MMPKIFAISNQRALFFYGNVSITYLYFCSNMPQITIKELAARLNLSISTVSRALSNSHEISKATRDKVMAMAQELNYIPNLYASGLRSQKSKTIAVIIPEILNNFFALAIDGIEEIAQENGYHVLVYLTHDDHVREASMVQHLLNGRVDGILMSVASETADTSHIAEFAKHGIPVVFFDRVCDNFDTIKFVTDDYHSGFNATKHLAERTCKNIAYLSISKNLSIDQKRMNGYLDACKRLKLTAHIVQCTQNDAENEQIITHALNADKSIDGVFASVEKLAISTYEVCNKLNISIPQQLKIVSFSNLRIASLLKPSLTTINQPAFEIGKQATVALFKALKNNTVFSQSEEVIIPSTLIERDSTSVKNN
jgi:LacI family transcriptional regulator